MRFKSFIYVLKLKKLNYPQLTSFIFNSGYANLLSSIINKNNL